MNQSKIWNINYKVTCSNESEIDELGNKINKLLEKMIAPQRGILGSAPAKGMQIMKSGNRARAGENGEPSFDRSQRNFSQSKQEITYYEGVDPCAWLHKYERYYQYNHITDPLQKLEEVVLNLNGKAESWFFSYHVCKGTVRCADCTTEISNRFEGATNSKLNLIGKFKNIEKKGVLMNILSKLRT